jgi:hypothetical protein
MHARAGANERHRQRTRQRDTDVGSAERQQHARHDDERHDGDDERDDNVDDDIDYEHGLGSRTCVGGRRAGAEGGRRRACRRYQRCRRANCARGRLARRASQNRHVSLDVSRRVLLMIECVDAAAAAPRGPRASLLATRELTVSDARWLFAART